MTRKDLKLTDEFRLLLVLYHKCKTRDCCTHISHNMVQERQIDTHIQTARHKQKTDRGPDRRVSDSATV